MYERLPSFVLGFHGCDLTVAEKVFAGRTDLVRSANDYDWLGHGIYFWESNAARALEFAHELQLRAPRGKAKLRKPAVIGAVIDLGRCLNLLDSRFLSIVRDGHRRWLEDLAAAGESVPENATGAHRLDCAVIEHVHQTRQDQGGESFDSVRGMFVEGEPLYPGAGFNEKNHVQICIRDPGCIQGYFRPRE